MATSRLLLRFFLIIALVGAVLCASNTPVCTPSLMIVTPSPTQSSSAAATPLPPGVVATIAGNSTSGFGGDGGAGTSAMLAYPYGVAVDAGGVVYIAD